MFLPLHFAVSLETHFHAGGLPIIYPLVELKDRFNRFVLVITNSEVARILEINLGQVSETLFAERPDLRERLGREWTREHYQNHRHHRDNQFVKEKVAVIERLMAKRGHNALLLAGEPRFVNRLREALPKHLQARIAGEIRIGVREDSLPEVIDLAIQSFLAQENRESHNAVRLLDEAVQRGGLAVVGLQPSLQALATGQADLLVLSDSLPADDREMLVREAARHDTKVETVRASKLLEQNGGVGCLLRYLLADQLAAARSA
jgi:stalled ribosome rescue protein Dom34